MRYRDAGVDVTRGDAIKQALARAVRATWNAGVVPLPHGFAGVMRWPDAATGLAHVTGGGIAGNLVRVLPEGCAAHIEAGAWRVPPLFAWLIEAGEVPREDARRAFNLGIGIIAVCAASEAAAVTRDLEAAGERVHAIGAIVAGTRGVTWSDET